MDHPMAYSITPSECRLARAALGWTQAELSRRASLSKPTVRDFERSVHIPRLETVAAIDSALRLGGVAAPERAELAAGIAPALHPLASYGQPAATLHIARLRAALASAEALVVSLRHAIKTARYVR